MLSDSEFQAIKSGTHIFKLRGGVEEQMLSNTDNSWTSPPLHYILIEK